MALMLYPTNQKTEYIVEMGTINELRVWAYSSLDDAKKTLSDLAEELYNTTEFSNKTPWHIFSKQKDNHIINEKNEFFTIALSNEEYSYAEYGTHNATIIRIIHPKNRFIAICKLFGGTMMDKSFTTKKEAQKYMFEVAHAYGNISIADLINTAYEKEIDTDTYTLTVTKYQVTMKHKPNVKLFKAYVYDAQRKIKENA